MAGLFRIVYFSAGKGNLFFGSFYFMAEKEKSIFCRPLAKAKDLLNKVSALMTCKHKVKDKILRPRSTT